MSLVKTTNNEIRYFDATTKSYKFITIDEKKVTKERPVCDFFLKGTCTFGNKCKNEHIGDNVICKNNCWYVCTCSSDSDDICVVL